MALPATVTVRISSEAVGAISLTPVVVDEMAITGLLEQIVAVTGLDVARVAAALRRGTCIAGASRFRWAAIESTADELARAVAALPAADPTRAFAAQRCTKAVLLASGGRLEIDREVATKRRLLGRESFWGHLLARSGHALYAGYLYGRASDLYRVELDEAARRELHQAAELLRYSGLVRQARARAWTQVELIVAR